MPGSSTRRRLSRQQAPHSSSEVSGWRCLWPERRADAGCLASNKISHPAPMHMVATVVRVLWTDLIAAGALAPPPKKTCAELARLISRHGGGSLAVMRHRVRLGVALTGGPHSSWLCGVSSRTLLSVLWRFTWAGSPCCPLRWRPPAGLLTAHPLQASDAHACQPAACPSHRTRADPGAARLPSLLLCSVWQASRGAPAAGAGSRSSRRLLCKPCELAAGRGVRLWAKLCMQLGGQGELLHISPREAALCRPLPAE